MLSVHALISLPLILVVLTTAAKTAEDEKMSGISLENSTEQALKDNKTIGISPKNSTKQANRNNDYEFSENRVWAVSKKRMHPSENIATGCPEDYHYAELHSWEEVVDVVDFILKPHILKFTENEDVTIGGVYDSTTGWNYFSGFPFNNGLWADGEPSKGEEFCLACTRNRNSNNRTFGLNNISCKWRKRRLCRKGKKRNYVLSKNGQFLFDRERMSAIDAKKQTPVGFRLAELHTWDEYYYALDFLQNKETGADIKFGIIIGAQRVRRTGWEWYSQYPDFNWKFWSQGEPNNVGGVENCGSVTLKTSENTSVGLNDVPCNISLPSLYKKGANCNDGWESDINYCYIMHMNIRMTYEDAKKECQHSNAHLVTIKNKKMADKVAKSLRLRHPVYFTQHLVWIGLRTKRNGKLGWDDKSPVKYVSWHDGKPNNLTQEYCVGFHIYSETWMASACIIARYFVCGKREIGQRAVCNASEPGLRNAHLRTKHVQIKEGQFAFYTCVDKYVAVKGDQRRECLANGQLDGSALKCDQRATCPHGWEPGTDHCYFVNNHYSSTFFTAEKDCEKMDAFVLSIKSSEQLKIVNDIRKRSDHSFMSFVWLGLKYENGKYVWNDGAAVSYTLWAEGNPRINHTQFCVEIDIQGTWSTVSCLYDNYVICEKPGKGKGAVCRPKMSGLQNAHLTRSGPIREGESSISICNNDYVAVSGDSRRRCLANGQLTGSPLKCKKSVKCEKHWQPGTKNCYLIGEHWKKYQDAKDACGRLNSFLASVPDGNENYVITNLMRKKRETKMYVVKVWLGLKDKKNDGTFEWEDGSTLKFVSWAKDKPKNDFIKAVHCVGMEKEGLWNVYNCTSEYMAYVCRKPARGNEKKCTALTTDLVNAKLNRTPKKIKEGHSAKYICKEGFKFLEGDQIRQCLVTGQLSGKPLKCGKR